MAGQSEDGEIGQERTGIAAPAGELGGQQASGGQPTHIGRAAVQTGQPRRQQPDGRPLQLVHGSLGERDRRGTGIRHPDHERRQFPLTGQNTGKLVNIDIGERDNTINRNIGRGDQCPQPFPSPDQHVRNSLRIAPRRRHSVDVTLFPPNG